MNQLAIITPSYAPDFALCADLRQSVQAMSTGLPQHIVWHGVARSLLGLAPADPPFTDYLCWLAPWDPRIVRALLRHVELVAQRPWVTAIGAQLHFSAIDSFRAL